MSRLTWNYSAEGFMMKVRQMVEGSRTMPRFKLLERALVKYLQAFELDYSPCAKLCQ